MANHFFKFHMTKKKQNDDVSKKLTKLEKRNRETWKSNERENKSQQKGSTYQMYWPKSIEREICMSPVTLWHLATLTDDLNKCQIKQFSIATKFEMWFK